MGRNREAPPAMSQPNTEPLLPDLASRLAGWGSGALRQLGRLGYSVELTAGELEQRLARHFPWVGEKWGMSLELRDPRLSIDPDGTLSLELALTVARHALVREGSLRLRGHLRYESETGGFFIAGIRAEHLELSHWAWPLWPVRKALEPALGWYFQRHPVVELQSERRGHALMRAVLDRIETHQGVLRLHLRLIRSSD